MIGRSSVLIGPILTRKVGEVHVPPRLLGLAPTIKAEGRFYAAAGDTKVIMVDVRDIASAAAAAQTNEGHTGKTYTLTGPEALSHAEVSSKRADAVGRTITLVDVSPKAMREALSHSSLRPILSEPAASRLN